MIRYRIIFIVIVFLGSSYLLSCRNTYKINDEKYHEIDYTDTTGVNIYADPNYKDTIIVDIYPMMISEQKT